MVDIFAWLNYLPLWLKPWERDARKRFKRDLEWCMARLEVSTYEANHLEAHISIMGHLRTLITAYIEDKGP